MPTATDTFAFTFTQWEMYDHYMACLQVRNCPGQGGMMRM